MFYIEQPRTPCLPAALVKSESNPLSTNPTKWSNTHWGVDIFEVPGFHLLQEMSSQCGSKKLLQGLVSHELTVYLYVFGKFLTQWIMVILSKGCKPNKFVSHNSLKLSFTNIRGLRSNFAECESFLESNSPEILALGEANLDDSIDSGNFSVRGRLPLIRKDSVTHMHGLAVDVKERLPFARNLSRENFVDC